MNHDETHKAVDRLTDILSLRRIAPTLTIPGDRDIAARFIAELIRDGWRPNDHDE